MLSIKATITKDQGQGAGIVGQHVDMGFYETLSKENPLDENSGWTKNSDFDDPE